MRKSQKKKNTQKNTIAISPTRITFVLLSAVLLLAFAQTLVQKTMLHFDDPTKVLGASVLGDEDKSSESNSGKSSDDDKKDEEERDVDESQNDQESNKSSTEESKKTDEILREQEKKRQEAQKEFRKMSAKSVGSNTSKTVTPTKSLRIKQKEDGLKQEVELESSDGQKVKIKTEDNGTTKVELEHGELKLRYKIVNGVVVKKVEDENGDEVELEDSQLDELENETEQELEDQGIELSSRSGKPSFVHNNVAAVTEFPLSVDVGTNQLVVTTSNGVKAVAILPDEALRAIVTQKIVTQSESTDTDSTQIDNKTTVELKVLKDEPVYEVSGSKEYKLFAFIPVSQKVKAVVSAETGQIVGVEKSFITNLVDILSP